MSIRCSLTASVLDSDLQQLMHGLTQVLGHYIQKVQKCPQSTDSVAPLPPINVTTKERINNSMSTARLTIIYMNSLYLVHIIVACWVCVKGQNTPRPGLAPGGENQTSPWHEQQ